MWCAYCCACHLLIFDFSIFVSFNKIIAERKEAHALTVSVLEKKILVCACLSILNGRILFLVLVLF